MRSIGLRSRAILLLVGVVIVTGGLTRYVSIHYGLRDEIRNLLVQRMGLLRYALSTSPQLTAALHGHRATPAARAELDRLVAAEPELVYALVVDDHGRPLLWSPHGARAAPLGLDSIAGRRAIIAAHAAGSGDSDRVLLSLPLQAGGGGHYQALVAMSSAAQLKVFGDLFSTAVLVSGAVSVLLIWLFFAWLFARLERLRGYAAVLASGDLTQRLSVHWRDEFGSLGTALESITDNLGQTITRVRTASIQTEQASSHIAAASRQIAGDAGTQAMAARQSVASMSQMASSAHEVEQRITDATHSAQQSAEHLQQISGAIDAVSTSVTQLSTAIEQTQQHIDGTTEFLSEVESAFENLGSVVESTATATTEITANINSADRNAKEALSMSEQASERATKGVDAVQLMVKGIEQTRDFADNAKTSIEQLSQRVASISSILDVINDIAAQTRMLSLNASIIAVQAGEHGRGFFVVAEEIKNLALKTGNATRDIAAVIDDVQRVSDGVIGVVEEGVQTIDAGIARSDAADEALLLIASASQDTGLAVRDIAKSMEEQAHGVQYIDHAMHDLQRTTERVRALVSRQRDNSLALQQAMTTMSALMSESLHATGEQSQQAQRGIQAIDTVFQLISHIAEKNNQQVASRTEAFDAAQVLENLAEKHRASARKLAEAVTQATEQARTLLASIEVFRV